MRRLLIVTNVDWFLISHRLIIAKAAAAAGWKVFVACEDTGKGHEIAVDGIEFIPFLFSRSGTNIIEEFRAIRSFRQLYAKVKPDLVHQITIKPVVYGGIAAKKEGVRGVVNAISGLGYMFAQGKIGFVQRAILYLMRMGARRGGVAFIFQNRDDENILSNFGILDTRNSSFLIKGSGVDLTYFRFSLLPNSEKIKILLPCRMLWDKGIKELREASEILKDKYRGRIQFVLVGMSDSENKSGVSEKYLKEWEDDDYVTWEGHQTDMIRFYRESHIVVLPSYREGLPKTLIEACAIGRPIVTTNAVGCKDCVDEGINGFKVPVGDSQSLAIAIETLINNRDMMVKMGEQGRLKAEREFDVKDVVNKHLEIYNSVLQ